MSNEKRKNIIEDVVESGMTFTETAKEQRVAVSTVNSVVNLFLNEGRLEPKQRGEVNQKVKKTKEISDILRETLDEDNVSTLKCLQSKLFENFDINISVSTIHKHLVKKIAYTLKIAKPLTLKRNDKDTLQKRFDFDEKVTKEDIKYNHNCIFVDEAGFNIS